MRQKKRDYKIRRNGKASIVLLTSLSILIGLSLLFTINSLSSYTLAATDEGQTGTTASYKSPLIWRMDEEGDYPLSELAAGKTYELADAIETSGLIKTFTASWEFKGEVTLALSANDGENYTPVVFGVPLTSGFISGNQLKWRVKLGQDSELTRIQIAYTDTSGAAGTFGNPELSGFNYRKPVYVANTSGKALFNYQIKVEIEEQEIKTKADFADIRFIATDKETLLPYYLESIRGDAPARIATYFVLLPQVPEGGLKIYLYYNNPDAEGLSSGEDVFDFFDDFAQDELDMEKWETYTDLGGGYELSNSRLRLDRTKIISQDYRFKNGIIEYQARAETGLESRLIIRGSEVNPEQVAYSSAYQGAEHCLAVDGIVKKNQNKPISAGVVYRYKVEADNDGLTFKRYLESSTYGADNLEAEVSYTDEDGIEQGYIGLETGEGSSAYYDWLRVRKYVEPEPYISALGDEEKVSLARFSGTTLANNGDIIASSASTSKSKGKAISTLTYTTAPIFTSCDISIIRSSLRTAEGSDAISIEISADGGLNWEKNCVSGKDYSAASDFTTGKHLLLRASFPPPVIASDSEAISELKLYYFIGPTVTSANIHCSGATGTGGVYMPGDTMVIEWNNSSRGDNNPDILSVSCNFAQFGGESAVRMYDDSDDIYNTSYELHEAINITANIIVTATNFCAVSDSAGYILTTDIPFEEAALPLPGEAIDEDEALDIEEEELAEEAQSLSKQLYDVVIKLGDNYHLDPEEDARGSYKHGDVVMVRLAGQMWSETERNSFLIVQAELTAEEAQNLTKPQEIATDELDNDDKPVMKRIGRRAKRVELGKYGLSKTDRRKEKLREVKNRLKPSDLKSDVVEKKERRRQSETER